ncbi:Protein kinase domain-containing protein [Psidium guajava]|nr:Protein kinase domain-containing protein [Psidium guajava]
MGKSNRRSRSELLLAVALSLLAAASGVTDPGDFAILKQFRDGLSNPELLQWPAGDDDPCGSKWKHVFCSGARVSQIEVQRVGLDGPLPPNLNQLTSLTHLGLQNNNFSGAIPSLSGLSNLQYAYLDFNKFDSIPSDFFVGLDSLQVLALDGNDMNASTGWMFPKELQNSPQLMNLTCNKCNLVGPVPEFLGSMASLQVLRLSGNGLTGGIPPSFGSSSLQILWLNDQRGGGLSGTIDVVTSMVSLTSLWLHGNSFSGSIPENIGDLASLKSLNLNGNKLAGLIPDSLIGMDLDELDLNNNHFMGPTPKFKSPNATCASNAFCLPTPGAPCLPEVMALIDFISALNYPARLLSSWVGNDPCQLQWFGLNCVSGKIALINLPKNNLNGTLSPSIANLDALTEVRLGSNNLRGTIPGNWTTLKGLTYLDLSDNNISPPIPAFRPSLKLLTGGNPLLNGTTAPSPAVSPPSGATKTPGGASDSPAKGSTSASGSGPHTVVSTKPKNFKSILVAIIAPVACVAALIFVAVPLYFYCKKRRGTSEAPSSLVVYPRDSSDPDNIVKIAVASTTNGSTSLLGSGSASRDSSGIGECHVIEAGNLTISVQVLRDVTKNFARENELGRGGFGVVYKGALEDGTTIAVKRMEAGIISNKALDEFQAEIAVLSKVRHRHLVSLLGYSVEGNERILVYEYMPQGALSRHLFHWKNLKLEPLTWKRRLNIALDVARGMEYLHTLAHQSFIHRDLKSSNILLGDDYRAKVSDFGLVKLAPDGEKSVATRLAGTFGYLAPEYAVTGKITTKADVFSFGVVLMELLTGLMALDEERPEESQYLVGYFWNIKSDKEKLMAAIDPTLDKKEETYESISTIAELAGHCTAREPNQRPDMGHAVNVLAPLVEKWKPFDDDYEEYSGIDYSLPLNQMVKDWQEAESKDLSYMDLEDSKGSIPTRPAGFADSFTSTDAR